VSPRLSSDERAALIEANMQTVRAQAGRYFRSWSRLRAVIDYDDLLQAGCIGLLEALERFDPSLGVPFGAWARHRIRGAILDSIAAMSPGTNVVVFSLEDEYSDPIVSSEASGIERRLTLAALLASLSPREREILAGLLGGDSLRKHAEQLSISECRVSQIKWAAVRKLQQESAPDAPNRKRS
jgi:RNA polymerase sigma factor (sigma-70 family)